MARPLTGQREVMRRLQERNAGRRQRTNEVREMGGLEPIPEPQPNVSNAMRMAEEQLRNYLSGYVGRPHNSETQRELLDSLMGDGFEPGRTHLIAGRSRPGRSSLGVAASQMAAYQAITGNPVMYLDTEANLNQNVYQGYGVARNLMGDISPRTISTQAPPWSMSYIDTGEPVGRDVQANLGSVSITEAMESFHTHSYASMWDGVAQIMEDKYEDTFSASADYMQYLMGNITLAEYEKRKKIKSIKDKENASNKDFKILLESEY